MTALRSIFHDTQQPSRLVSYDAIRLAMNNETLEEVLNELPFWRHGLPIGSEHEEDALR